MDNVARGDILGRMAYQSPGAMDELIAFVAVVEARGFTAAARASHGRKATLSKRVQDLEHRLGVPLLVRTTRALRLTEEGRAYLEHARRAVAAARDAETVVAVATSRPHGLLRVTMTASIAEFVLDGPILAYLAKYPDVAVDLDTSNRRVDLVREGFDLAVRSGAMEDSSLIARRLGVANGGFYASPRYLAKRGVPSEPRQLAAHDLISVPKANGATEWQISVRGKRKQLAIRPRLVVSDVDLSVRAAAGGAGIVRAPLQVAQRYLARRQLVAILADYTPPGLEIHAVFPPGGGIVPKTRVFLELLERWFRAAKQL